MTTEHKSRWGFHTCDYTTFLKLKALKKWFWQMVYDKARFHRWYRKTVYRTGPEPQFCDILSSHNYQNCNFLTWFEEARIPRETPPEVLSEYSVAAIEELYVKVRDYYEPLAKAS